MKLECVLCETPEQFSEQVSLHQQKGHAPIIRGRKLIVYGEIVAELAPEKRGGWRNGGRHKIEGKECRWIIPQDVYDIAKARGKKFIWDAVRFKVAFEQLQNAE